MDTNDSITPQKKNSGHQSVIIMLMITAVLLIAELYVLTNLPGNFIALGIVTVLFLVSAYFFGNSILKEIQDNNARITEQFEALTKSGKASYLMMKKSVEQLEEMESKASKPTEEIITAQKAISKVIINRNKENTDAMMNSNDKVLEKIFDFEEVFGTTQNNMLDKQRSMLEDSMGEVMRTQLEVTASMKAMEESIKNQLLQLMNSMQELQAQTISAVKEMERPVISPVATPVAETPVVEIPMVEPMMEEPTVEEVFDITDSLDLGVSEELSLDDLGISEDMDFAEGLGLSEELGLGTDLGIGEDLGLGEEISLGDDLGVSEELSLEDLGISEDMDFAEGLGLSEELNLGDDLSLSEEVNLGDDFGIDSDLDLGIDLLPEETPVEETKVEEVVAEPEFVEEAVQMPDLSDPHKLMTPEEIAALIAKM